MGSFTLFREAIYNFMVYIAMRPMKTMPIVPPIMPTVAKLAGVAKIPIPTNTFNMLKLV